MPRMGYDDNTTVCAKAVRLIKLIREFTAHYKLPVKYRMAMAEQVLHEAETIGKECSSLLNQHQKDQLYGTIDELEHHKRGKFFRYDEKNRGHWAKR